jgi:uncharacterized protein YndB with AHSA1/START domain
VRVSASTSVPEPPEDVWRFLLHWERQAEWMRDADAVRVVSAHREGLGVRIAVRTRVLGVPLFTEPLEVVAWEPPGMLRLAHRGRVRGHGTWALSPVPGGTRFTWTEELSLSTPVLGEAALLVYRPVMRRLMRGSLANLRAALTGSA